VVGVEEITVAGFQAVVLVVFLVQTIIEAFPSLRGRYTPIVAAVVGITVAAVSVYAPENLTRVLGTGLALAASASLAVRYVKRGDEAPAQQVQQPGVAPIVVDFGDPQR